MCMSSLVLADKSPPRVNSSFYSSLLSFSQSIFLLFGSNSAEIDMDGSNDVKRSSSLSLLNWDLVSVAKIFGFHDRMNCRAFMVILFLFVSVLFLTSFSVDIKFQSTKYLSVSLKIAEYSFSSKEDVESFAVLLPDREVLVIISPGSSAVSSGDDLFCLYPNDATSPAKFSGVLRSTNQTTFKCVLPRSSRSRRRGSPLLSPVLIRSSDKELPFPPRSPEPMLKWNRLAYESVSTETDVVLFAKGINNRKGINRSPQDFRCVFTDETNSKAVKTAVTSSVQEVFRCEHPDLTAFSSGGNIKISLENLEEGKRINSLLPSVAYYNPWRKLENQKPKSLLCASTMVFDVAKFLREWVMYHSKIGVEKFVLYDNDSDDDLMKVIKELNQEGYDIETLFWIWPKTQEAGFAHAALYAKDSCTWMMYIDVDEFVFVPSWASSSQPPIDHMLEPFLPTSSSSIGQVSIRCNEFGPSNQKSHPSEGVIQGYTCRNRIENRHKSIVLLDAMDHSLDNAIHHFKLKENYKTKTMRLDAAVVNHYKYQAWPEFKAKFRRRVSTYVVDWKRPLNALSKDRAPGLGFKAIEPPGWEHMFCEVEDDRLKLLTQGWFGKQTMEGFKMAWQL